MSSSRRRTGIHRPTEPRNEWPETRNDLNSMPTPSDDQSVEPTYQNPQALAQTRMRSQRSQQPVSMDGFLDDDETTAVQRARQSGQPVMPYPPSSLSSPRSSSMPSQSNLKPGQMGKSRAMAQQKPVASQEPIDDPSSINGIEDDEYKQFLEWKKAKQERAARSQAEPNRGTTSIISNKPSMDAMASPVSAMPVPVDSTGSLRSMPEPPIAEVKSTVRPQSHEHAVNDTVRPAVNNTVKPDNRSAHDRPVGQESPVIHRYPGYNGTGYPKGLGHGPIVERTNIKTGKRVKIEGMAWEDFPPAYQRMLDRQPYDDAGELRIFVKSNGKVSQQYPFYELGSDEHSKKFMDELKSKRDLILNNGVDLSYPSRPQLDAMSWLPPAK